MNEQLRPRSLAPATQAAEGLPRRRWSVAEIEAMVANGIILEDERFELIGGEVVPMSPKGNRHELVKRRSSNTGFPSIAGTPIDLITETTLYVGDDEFLEPDFLFWSRAMPLAEREQPVRLFSSSRWRILSLAYDLGRKASIYARLGLPELWVIDARSLVTTIHRDPASAGYSKPREADPTELLEPLLAPHLAVRLGDLGLG